MADTLPPLELMPELQSGESASPSARWAHRFGGQDRSLAQRTRHNEDIRAFAEDLQHQRELHQQEELRTNKGARDLYFRQRTADLKEVLAEKKLRMDAELHNMRLQNMEAAQEAAHALARERIAREKAINDKATKDATNRSTVFEKWSALNNDTAIKQGSPEYARRTLDILVQHGGGLDASTRKMLTDTAKVTVAADPTEAADEAVAGWESIHTTLKEKGLNAKVVGRLLPSGKMGFTISEPAAATKQPLDRAGQIDKALPGLEKEWRTAKTKTPDAIPVVEPAIEALRKEREGLSSPAPVAAAAERKVRKFGRDAEGNLGEIQ